MNVQSHAGTSGEARKDWPAGPWHINPAAAHSYVRQSCVEMAGAAWKDTLNPPQAADVHVRVCGRLKASVLRILEGLGITRRDDPAKPESSPAAGLLYTRQAKNLYRGVENLQDRIDLATRICLRGNYPDWPSGIASEGLRAGEPIALGRAPHSSLIALVELRTNARAATSDAIKAELLVHGCRPSSMLTLIPAMPGGRDANRQAGRTHPYNDHRSVCFVEALPTT